MADFTDTIRSIAQTESMRFVDGGAELKQGLNTLNAMHQADPIINMGVESNNGMGLMAGNLGLPGYQVAIGFSEGSSPSKAHAFAGKVVARLKTHWRVETAPSDTGAVSLKTCAK